MSLGILLMGVLFFSCASKVTVEKTAPATLTEEGKVTGKESWQAEWERTLAGARKEGKVVVYDTLGSSVTKALGEGFTNRTGIMVEFVSGRGGEISQKLLTERRNGLFIPDAYIGGATTIISVFKPSNLLSPIYPLLFLPEVLDTNLWYKKSLPWVDTEKKFLLGTAGVPSGMEDYTFHGDNVREEEINSYYDLLQPRWKGKMSLQDPTTAGKGNTWFYAALVFDGMSLDYMKSLAQQEPVLTRDNRQQIEWIAKGKHLIAIAGDQTVIKDFGQIGVPLVGKTVKEHASRMAAHSANIVVIDRMPHPTAAKLFLNWYLSKEGQTAFALSYPSQSYREDVGADHLELPQRRDPKINYRMENEVSLTKKAEMISVASKIFSVLK